MPNADDRIIANVERLHAHMDRHRLAAVVARSGQNFTYLAGAAHWEEVLEEGMVLALEPHRDYWHIQDMVVVRAGGPELISDRFSTNHPFVVESA